MRSHLQLPLQNLSHKEVALACVRLGAPIALVRMGSLGSVIAYPTLSSDSTSPSPHSPQSYRVTLVPAVSGLTVVDETGAGNAMCGAFLVALTISGNDHVEAAVAATACASLAVEQVGPAPLRMRFSQEWSELLRERMRQVRSGVVDL